MNPETDRVLQAALALADQDQLQLLDALVAAVDERGLRPLDDAWLAEIERRSAEFDAGMIQPVPWHEVKERARRSAARSSARD